ncbi:hypothetical protein TNCV_301351 [Trichonephila clavipes]|nr:hypothetical protein TNCV_301351 [Trichonephila clavipes]
MSWLSLAYSPNLHSIEYLWDAPGSGMSSFFPPPTVLIELQTALQNECGDHLILWGLIISKGRLSGLSRMDGRKVARALDRLDFQMYAAFGHGLIHHTSDSTI